MKKEQEILGWRRCPEPNGTLYFKKDLSDKRNIGQLFNHCKTSEAYINSDGWQYLFDTFGIYELLKIDAESGWFRTLDETSVKKEILPNNSEQADERFDIKGLPDEMQQIKVIIYHALIAGYNPIAKEKGDYDEESGFFFTLDGFKMKFDWDKVNSSTLY